MADIWMDVDAALAEVPVNIMPLIDDTDFKSREVSVAYNASGMDLVWNFVSTAGAFTQTAVTPTTSGDYDWTNQGDGMYSLEIPASGGASINNDTEGFGWFTGFCTGVLPWRGPIIGLRAAALNNSLIDAGSTGLLAPTVAARNLDVSTGGEAGIDWANIGSPTTAQNLSATNIDVDQVVASVSGAVGSVTGAVGSVTGNVGGNVTGSVGSVASGGITAASIANGAIDAATFATDAIDANAIAADAVTEIQAGLGTSAEIAAVQADTDNIQTRIPAALVSGRMSSDAVAISGSTAAADAVEANIGNLDAAVSTRATPAQILTTALTEAYAADGAAGTLTQILYAIQQFLQERVVSGVTVTVNELDGATPAMTFTLDSATVPTSITRAT